MSSEVLGIQLHCVHNPDHVLGAEFLKKFDAGLEKSNQERQEIGQSIEQSQKVLDRLDPQQRRAKKNQKNAN